MKQRLNQNMIKYENECVGCPESMSCIGYNCPNSKVPHLYCDKCKEEHEELYVYDDEQLCSHCILNNFKRVSLEDE